MFNMFEGKSNDSERNPEEAAAHARRFSGGEERFREMVDSVATLVQMLKDYRGGSFRMSLKEVAVLLGALVYVVNPVDAVPEAVVGPAGLVDDAGIVLAALASLSAAIMRYRATRLA